MEQRDVLLRVGVYMCERAPFEFECAYTESVEKRVATRGGHKIYCVGTALRTLGGDDPSGPTGTYVQGVDPQKGLANQC